MRGFCYLLATGQTSPWHKTREMVDSPRYRAIWDMVGPIVAILSAREKPKIAVRPSSTEDYSDEFPA